MATIKDGIKIGFGLLLFKWLLGMGGCVALLGATCLVCSPKSCDLPSFSSSPSSSSATTGESNIIEKPEVKSLSNKTKVHYSSGCNLREEPSSTSRKVGFAPTGTYSVLEQKGKWRKIEVGDVTGWAGCGIGARKAVVKDED